MVWGVTEGDGLAIAMLATILLSFGVIVMLFVCMLRNASKRDKGVDGLLEEMEEDEKKEATARVGRSKSSDRKEDWEREGDWWKEGD